MKNHVLLIQIAYMQFHKSLSPLVGWFVSHTVQKHTKTCVTSPSHLYDTDAAVYTVLFLQQSNVKALIILF